MIKNIIRKSVRDEKGLTLLELVIAIMMLGIISLAAFKGMEFAFYAASSSDEYVENVYAVQGNMESDLTLVDTLTGSEDASDFTLGDSDADETIYFDWQSGSGLRDFQTKGVRVQRDAEGGSHMDTPVYVFIPVVNEDQ